MTRRIDISYKTIIFITLFLVALWIIFQILDIILLFFVAFIIMSALSPAVEKLVSWKVPRIVAVVGLFITVIGMIVGIIALGFTPLMTETSSLGNKLSETVGFILQTNLVDQSIISQEISKLSGNIFNITIDVFRNFISFVSVIIVSLYMLLDRGKIEHFATSFFGSHKNQSEHILVKIEEKLGAWLRGQAVLSLVIGLSVYIGLWLLGIEYALPLAIIAALFEVVPVIGPIVSAIPAILIALTISPVLAAGVAGLYLLIQQLEGHLVVPQVMKRAVGLNPLLVILAISIGSRLLGIGGALLAVPIAAVIQIVAEEILKPTENSL